jgi:hypothetical protein
MSVWLKIDLACESPLLFVYLSRYAYLGTAIAAGIVQDAIFY